MFTDTSKTWGISSQTKPSVQPRISGIDSHIQIKIFVLVHWAKRKYRHFLCYWLHGHVNFGLEVQHWANTHYCKSTSNSMNNLCWRSSKCKIIWDQCWNLQTRFTLPFPSDRQWNTDTLNTLYPFNAKSGIAFCQYNDALHEGLGILRLCCLKTSTRGFQGPVVHFNPLMQKLLCNNEVQENSCKALHSPFISLVLNNVSVQWLRGRHCLLNVKTTPGNMLDQWSLQLTSGGTANSFWHCDILKFGNLWLTGQKFRSGNGNSPYHIL